MIAKSTSTTLGRSRLRMGTLAAALLLICGCGDNKGALSGTITFDGQPVGRGMITLLPADGKGPAAGGTISGGYYRVTEITPGPKIAKIEAVKAVPFARSSDEMAQRAAANKAKGDGTGIIDPADIIPANADGNNAAIEIRAGTQTHDFHLQSKARPPSGS